MKKNAQVTIFIIIGLVIVISALLFFILKGNIERKEIAPGVSMIVEELPTEFISVAPFVESCLKKTAEQGLEILGRRGGYIYTDNFNQGNSVELAKDFKIPYWYYLSSADNCRGKCDFTDHKLPLRGKTDSVEAHLSRYIDENLHNCVDHFKSLRELSYEVIENKDPKTKTTITANNVVVKLDYPLEIKRGEATAELTQFYSNIDLDLDNIYQMADYVTKLENTYRFLEKSTLNLIVAFSGINKNKLPPMSGSEFKVGGGVKWHKPVVKNRIKTLITTYTPVLRMANTLNWVNIDTGNLYQDKLYNYGLSIPNNSSISNLGVSFTYLNNFDMYFNLNCRDQVCEPESAFTDLIPIGLQRYNFAYDISYPVMVELEDPSAFNDKGYTFNFMLEANIRKNKPLPSDYNPLLPINKAFGTMLCDENKRTSGDINIKITDSLDDTLVDDVNVIFNCIESCYIGSTVNGNLNTQFPVCLGGSVSFSKEDYETQFIPLNTVVGKDQDLEISLNPKKELNIIVKKKLIQFNGEISDTEEDLSEFESVFITIEKDNDYNIIELTKDLKQTAKFSEGIYEIEVNLMTEKQLFFPEEVREYDGQYVTIPEINISEYTNGRTKINKTFWKSDLQNNELILYVGYINMLSREDLAVNTLDYSNSYKLIPKTR